MIPRTTFNASRIVSPGILTKGSCSVRIINVQSKNCFRCKFLSFLLNQLQIIQVKTLSGTKYDQLKERKQIDDRKGKKKSKYNSAHVEVTTPNVDFYTNF